MEYLIEPALAGDREAILAVMRPWNMHHVPSREMEELDAESFFVARVEGRVVGAAGWKILSQTRAKTTLLGVLPEFARHGIGAALQEERLRAMARVGVTTVVTNADRPEVVAWYERRYGYRKVGSLKKVSPFGHQEIDRWTTLELDLEAWVRRADAEAASRDYLERNEPHPLKPYPPLLINACLTGMIPTKAMTAFVPLTTEEIVADALRCYDAGARILHLHARDAEGCPTWRAEVYERILLGIRRERPDAICCVSTSGRNWQEFEKRAEVLLLEGAAKPDMASLTLGSLNFPTGASINAPETIQRLAETMRERGIRPELEVFDAGMVGFAKYLERRGVLSGRKYFNLLLGSLGSMPATLGNLAALVAALPEDSTWAAAGIGLFQLPMNAAAVVAGGGVRVGLEDNLHYDHARTRLASNAELVARVARLGVELQRPLATPVEARALAGLPTSRRAP
ncbi:MAG: GNAT family N-acetyltransferase [Planctomycetaceae bacterium]